MNLIIDIGNTLAKIAVYSDNKLINLFIFNNFSTDNLLNVLLKHPQIKKVILASVVKHDSSIEKLISKNFHKFLILDHKAKFPFKINYKTKNTLGIDRIAGVAGAYNIYPESNVLIFDLGTALTVDFLNYKNEFCGGNISPGLSIRFRALHDYTGKLPLCEKSETIDMISDNTNSAIVSGVVNGLIFEIDEYINRYSDKYEDLKIILTGGDCLYFEKKLKNTIFVEPNLVLQGLNTILNYNV